MLKKEFTESEKNNFKIRKEIVKSNWNMLSLESRKEKTKGLCSMNERDKCSFCDFESTKGHVRGHIKRKHGDINEN